MADSPLAKFPPGVLELLSLKTLGQAPSLFGELVVPTFEMLDFYGADRIVGVAENGPAAAIGSTFSSAAAVNYRRLLGFSATLIIGAAGGTNGGVAIGINVPGQTSPTLFGVANLGAVVAGGFYRVAGELPCPLVLPPGHTYVAISYGNPVGTDHQLQLRYTYQRLDLAS